MFGDLDGFYLAIWTACQEPVRMRGLKTPMVIGILASHTVVVVDGILFPVFNELFSCILTRKFGHDCHVKVNT